MGIDNPFQDDQWGILARIAFVAILAVLLGLSLGHAYRVRESAEDHHTPGMKRGPRNPNPLLNWLRQIRHVLGGERDHYLNTLSMAVFGIVVPTLMFALLVTVPALVDPSPVVFESEGGLPLQSLDPSQTVAFVIGQMIRGATADALELFRLQPGHVLTDPSALPFNLVVLGYRLTIQVFEFAFVINTLAPAWLALRKTLRPR